MYQNTEVREKFSLLARRLEEELKKDIKDYVLSYCE